VKGIINEPKKLLQSPLMGQEEELLKQREIDYRYLIFKNYKLIYSVDTENGFIKIADVFDTRQNPPKIKRTK
jgi:plasmid stabilization system protein ParE